MWSRITLNILQQARPCYKQCLQHIPRIAFAAVAIKMGSQNTEPRSKLEPPDQSTLSHTYFTKNAAVATVTSASGLLTQTVTAYIDEVMEYQDALNRLIGLYDLSLEVLFG